jgi:hypothetical protein
MTEQDIRGLRKLNNFINAWFNALPNYRTYEEAYESIEDIYFEYYQERRYSGYKSFEVMKNRHTKQNRK